MAILVLWSSPDLDGITAHAKNHLIEGILSSGKEVQEIHLNRKIINTCLACGKAGYGKCRTDGRCVLKDDLDEIYQSMCDAEAIAFITPVYWHDMSENFKALLDRIRRCETSKNHFLRDKRYMLITCAGGFGLGVTDALVHMETTLSHMGMKALDRIPIVRFNQEYMISAIRDAGRNFAEQYKDFRFDGFTW